MKSFNDRLNIDETLKKYWGYDSFRPMQRQIIEQVLSGRDTLALLPTGGGKSIIYQIPALVSEGVCIVITPLIALMKDQVDRLRSLSIPAVAIHSGLSQYEIENIINSCIYGRTKILYIAPERITSRNFAYQVAQMKVSLIAVDEAHCISQWGYDFRPSYLKIYELRKITPDTPVLALTASATTAVCEDIMRNLHFNEKSIFRGDFSRPNLSYVVRTVDDKIGQLSKILNSVDGSAIIYTSSRKLCETLAAEVKELGYSSTYYHAGLPNVERSLRQDDWLSGECRVMVATNAFGMGIDKPDVRLVVHYTLCDSLEAYYQEAGRAGRDGKRSYAVLLTSEMDYAATAKLISKQFPTLEFVKDIYDKICASLNISYGEGCNSGFKFNLNEFCIKNGIYPATMTNAVKLLQMNGYLTLYEDMSIPSRIMFIVSRDDLYKIRIGYEEFNRLLDYILRTYNGVFSDMRYINEATIAANMQCDAKRIKEMLIKLSKMRILRYIPSNRTAIIHLDRERVPIADIFITPQSYTFRKECYEMRYANMTTYGKNMNQCRSQLIERYFGIADAKECGVCDICISKRQSGSIEINLEERIKELLSENTLTIKELSQQIKHKSDLIVEVIEQMIAAKVIIADNSGYLHLNDR